MKMCELSHKSAVDGGDTAEVRGLTVNLLAMEWRWVRWYFFLLSGMVEKTSGLRTTFLGVCIKNFKEWIDNISTNFFLCGFVKGANFYSSTEYCTWNGSVKSSRL